MLKSIGVVAVIIMTKPGWPESHRVAKQSSRIRMNSHVCLAAMTISAHVYRDYPFTIQYLAKDPIYSVNFPDIPQIIPSGETLTEAFANACEALDLCLESLEQLGQPAPLR